MRRSRKIVIHTIGVIVCLTILATPVWLYLINEYAKEHGLVTLNIYPVEPVNDYRPDRITIHYMICRPAETEEALKEQIDAYLEEEEVVPTLLKQYHVVEAQKLLSLYFIRPTDHWPIGKVTTEQDGNVGFQGDMRLCEIIIDGADPDNWRYEFFPENFEEQQ